MRFFASFLSVFIVLCALLSVSDAGAQWTSSQKAADGVWQWQGDTAAPATMYLSAERIGDTLTRLRLQTVAPVIGVSAKVEVAAGKVTAPGVPALSFARQDGALTVSLSAAAGEQFYGLGEKYNSVNQRGNVADMQVNQGYRSLGDTTYLPIPMFISSNKYGFYLDSFRRSKFDMASDNKNVVVTLPADEMTLYVWTGKDYADLMQQYCQVTGLPEAPPEWAFGIWLSKSSYFRQDEVLNVARQWRANELPLALFNIEGWMGKTYHTFAEDRFPDPRAMIQELHSYGWKVMLWNVHNITPTDPDFKIGDEKGYFVKNRSGKTFMIPSGYGAGGCIDITNPEAVQWWLSLYDPLIELGVDAFFNDITNYLDGDPGTVDQEPMLYHNGKSSEDMYNAYWLGVNKIMYEYMKAKTGNDTVLRSAGGWAGQQKYSTIWAGDSGSEFKFLERDIKALLSSGWSCIPYFGYDIPGYDGTSTPPSPELYKRWVEFGALSPMMQFHTTANPEPWHYGEEAVEVLRNYGWFRESLRPYLYSLALEAQETGAPMARSLAWEFPQDTEAAKIEDEYLLGKWLLVAPVYTPGTQRKIYLPAGNWMDWTDGSHYTGPCWIEAQAPVDFIPVYLREGGIIPQRLDAQMNFGSGLQEQSIPTLEILPSYDKGETKTTWYHRYGNATISCKREKLDVTVKTISRDLPTGTILRLEVGTPVAVTVDGKPMKALSEAEVASGSKIGYVYRPTEQVCLISPIDEWSEIKLTEQYGQMQFEKWSAPAQIAANAKNLRIAVSLPQQKPDTVPALAYQYKGGTGLIAGRSLGDSRWQFDAPVQISEKDEDFVWSVTAQSKLDQTLKSRDRVTVVQCPAQMTVNPCTNLAKGGEITALVKSVSASSVKCQLLIEAPEGFKTEPAQVSINLGKFGQEKQVQIRCIPVTGKVAGLGDHPVKLKLKVGETVISDQTVLAQNPYPWEVVGPFETGLPITQMDAAIAASYGPEESPLEWQESFTTKDGKQLTWEAFPSEFIAQDGMLDIEAKYGKIDMSVAYLRCKINSPVARDVLIKTGSDDSDTIWLNGEKIYDYPSGRMAVRDQFTVKAHLNAGENRILVKVFDITDAWRLYFRITDAEGKPLGDFTAVK